MSRELWLLRHGKSERDLEMDDFDRPLKKRGKRNARQLGAWMRQQQLIPDTVLSSPAKRAIATAKLVYKYIGDDCKRIQQDKRLYFQSVEQLKAVLAECPKNSKRVLLVGHNPELEELLIDLIGSANVPDTEKLLPTAALARITIPDDWSNLDAGCAELLSITYAKSLPELN